MNLAKIRRKLRRVRHNRFGTPPSLRQGGDDQPSVTLVIASFRYGHLAAHAIESALSQSRPFSHILFVDDGVGDCAHLPALYPDVEFVFRKKNLGTVANFQDMLQSVKTDRVMFLGADNWLRDDTLESLNAVSADVVTYDIQITGNRRDHLIKHYPDEIYRFNGGWYWDRSIGYHGSMLYNADLAREVGGYESPPERAQTIEDRVLYEKMISFGAKRVHVPAPLLFYRRHSENFNPT